MRDQQVNPVIAAVVVVVVLLVGGAIWYFNTNQAGGGTPSAGQAGRADPTLGGGTSVMSRAPQRRDVTPRAPVGPGGTQAPVGR